MSGADEVVQSMLRKYATTGTAPTLLSWLPPVGIAADPGQAPTDPG